MERKSFLTSPRTWGFSFHCCVLTDRSLALSHLPVLDCHFSLPCPPHYSPCRSPHKSNNCQPFSLKGFIACRLIVPRQNEHGFCAVHCRLLRPEVISEFSPLVHLLHMSSFGVVFWSSPLSAGLAVTYVTTSRRLPKWCFCLAVLVLGWAGCGQCVPLCSVPSAHRRPVCPTGLLTSTAAANCYSLPTGGVCYLALPSHMEKEMSPR